MTMIVDNMVSDLQPKTDFIPADLVIIEDLDTLKVLADPLRLRLRELLEQPSTVKQIAQKLNMLPTKLYYHINLLEKHNLIVLVDTRIVSGIIEKHYQISAKQIRVAKHLLSTGDDPQGEGLTLTIGTLFDTTRDELLKAARAGMVEWDDEGERHKGLSLHLGSFNLSDEQASSFYQEMDDLVNRYHTLSNKNTDATDCKSYQALYLLFPKQSKSDQ